MIDTIKNNFVGTIKCNIPEPSADWTDNEWMAYYEQIKLYKNRLYK